MTVYACRLHKSQVAHKQSLQLQHSSPPPIISPPHLSLNGVSCSNCGNPSSEGLTRHCAINRVRSREAAMAAPVRIEHVAPVAPAKTRSCEMGGGGGGGLGGVRNNPAGKPPPPPPPPPPPKRGGSGTSLLGTPSSTMSCRSTLGSDRRRSLGLALSRAQTCRTTSRASGHLRRSGQV